MDLPESIRLPAMDLVNDMYGPLREDPYAFYETDDFKAYIMSEDYQSKLNSPNAPRLPPELRGDYQEYLKEYLTSNPQSGSSDDTDAEVQKKQILREMSFDREMHYQNYNNYKTDEFYRRLDEIFDDYIKK